MVRSDPAAMSGVGRQVRTRKVPGLARQYGRAVPPAFDPHGGGSDAGGLVTARRL